MKRLIASLAAATALATAAPAAADGNINPAEKSYADTYGASVICVVIAAYPNPDGVLGTVMGIVHDGFTPDSAVDILNYSVATYCNQYWDLLVRTGDIYRQQGPLKRAV